MAEYYTLQVAGLTRKLKRCRISDKLEIAAFMLFRSWLVPKNWRKNVRTATMITS